MLCKRSHQHEAIFSYAFVLGNGMLGLEPGFDRTLVCYRPLDKADAGRAGVFERVDEREDFAADSKTSLD